MRSFIEFQNVSKTYQMDGVGVKALSDVNLKIDKGNFVAIVGPSGSGKSTLLHILGALDKPTSGEVYLDGRNISNLDDSELAKIRLKKIGFVFQFFNLYPTLTAQQNIELPMVIAGSEEKQREKRSRELLKIVKLRPRAKHFPAQLSGGERQRIAIARALANKPPIILADEPTGNLDTKSGKDVMKTLINLNKKYKITLIVITHEKKLALNAKRVYYLRDGQIIKRRIR